MTRPPPIPTADATRLGWLQLAGAWSRATRRLLDGDFPEVQLALVALYLALDYAAMLVLGEIPTVPHNPAARADFPIDPRRLPKVRERMQDFRDAILHHGRRMDGKRRVLTGSWSSTPPTFTLKATVGKAVTKEDSITKEEILELLDKLDAWVARHFARMSASVR